MSIVDEENKIFIPEILYSNSEDELNSFDRCDNRNSVTKKSYLKQNLNRPIQNVSPQKADAEMKESEANTFSNDIYIKQEIQDFQDSSELMAGKTLEESGLEVSENGEVTYSKHLIQDSQDPLKNFLAKDQFDEMEFRENECGESVKRNRKLRRVMFSEEIEEDLGLWFKNNELFYNKRIKAYRDTEKKQRLFQEKANSLNPPCTVLELKTWMDSMRTRYGRLTEPNLGKDVEALTHRDQWVVDTFKFLNNHIVRAPHRNSAKFAKSVSFHTNDTNSTTVENFDLASKDLSCNFPPETSLDKSVSNPKKKKRFTRNRKPSMHTNLKNQDSDLAEFLTLTDEANTASKNKEDLTMVQNNHHEAVQHWVNYQSTQLVNMNPLLWEQYSIASMNLLLQFMAESRRLQENPLQNSLNIEHSLFQSNHQDSSMVDLPIPSVVHSNNHNSVLSYSPITKSYRTVKSSDRLNHS